MINFVLSIINYQMSTYSKSFINTILILITSLFSATFSPERATAQIKEGSEQFYYMEGLRQYNIGSLDEAQKIFLNMAGKGTKNDAVYYYLSNIYLHKRDLKKAEEAVKTAVSLDPVNYWYSIQLAKIYEAQNDLDNAIKVYEELRGRYPQKPELYDDLIDIYIEKKELAKARQVVEDVEKFVGKNEATGLTRYNLLVYENKPQEAIEFLKNFDQEYGTPRTSTLLGDYFSSKQIDSSALYYYNKALSMDPTYIPASFGQAEIYRIKGKFDLYFERMYPFFSNPDVDVKMKVSYMSQILSNPKFVATFKPQVDTMLNNLYNAHQNDTSVIYSYAVYLVQTGRDENGLRILKDNLKHYPDSKEAHKQYLSLIYYLKDWNSLIDNCDSALVFFPEEPGFLELKGIGLMQSKRIAESIDIFKKILKLSKGDSASTVRNLAILGDLYYESGDKKESFKYYNKTLKINPNHISTLNNYAYYLCGEARNLKKAYKMSKKTIEREPDNPTYLDTYAWILHLLKKDIEAKAIIKHAMLYGGSDDADILDHYAEILYSLKEYDLAYIYWNQADKLDPSLGIAEKIANRKKTAK